MNAKARRVGAIALVAGAAAFGIAFRGFAWAGPGIGGSGFDLSRPLGIGGSGFDLERMKGIGGSGFASSRPLGIGGSGFDLERMKGIGGSGFAFAIDRRGFNLGVHTRGIGGSGFASGRAAGTQRSMAFHGRR